MTKTDLKQITDILPFDEKYILVGKGSKTSKKWNLMDAGGKLISETWFTSISKNSDGSVKTEVRAKYARKAVSTTFISTDSFAKASRVMDIVPVACFSLVDTGTMEPYTGSDKRYIAKAKLYGRDVFIDKNGNIYDSNGVKLRLLFNTVDSERLTKAVRDFNKKMHYDFEEVKTDSFSEIFKNSYSMWVFYFVTDDMGFNTTINGITNGTKRWTDDLVVRMFKEKTSERVLKAMESALGASKDSKREFSGGEHHFAEWHFKKDDLEKIIGALAAA